MIVNQNKVISLTILVIQRSSCYLSYKSLKETKEHFPFITNKDKINFMKKKFFVNFILVNMSVPELSNSKENGKSIADLVCEKAYWIN